MNGLPLDAPQSLIRKSSERSPMLDLDAMDEEAAELERTRTAQLEAKEKSEHQAKLEASAPAPVKAKPAKREKA